MRAAVFLSFKLGVRLIPVHAGSLKLFSSMKSACVCVCVPAPRLLKTIHVK